MSVNDLATSIVVGQLDEEGLLALRHLLAGPLVARPNGAWWDWGIPEDALSVRDRLQGMVDAIDKRLAEMRGER